MKTIVVTMQKGGVGKTTTAENIGCGLREQGKRVLLIDLDKKQGSLSYIMGASETGKTVFDVLMNGKTNGAIQTTECGDLIPYSEEMRTFESKYANVSDIQYSLRKALSKIKPDTYDYVVIDTPVDAGLILDIALCCADYIVLPTTTGVQPLNSLIETYNDMSRACRKLNPNMQILGIVVTMYRKSNSAAYKGLLSAIEDTASQIDTRVLGTVSDSVTFEEQQGAQLDLFRKYPNPDPDTTYNFKKTKAATDYRNIVKQIIKIIEG